MLVHLHLFLLFLLSLPSPYSHTTASSSVLLLPLSILLHLPLPLHYPFICCTGARRGKVCHTLSTWLVIKSSRTHQVQLATSYHHLLRGRGADTHTKPPSLTTAHRGTAACRCDAAACRLCCPFPPPHIVTPRPRDSFQTAAACLSTRRLTLTVCASVFVSNAVQLCVCGKRECT